MANTLGKALTLLFWLAAAYNLLLPFPGQVALWVNIIAGLLLAAHAVECIVFKRHIHEHHANNPLTGYVLVLLFGVLHSGQWLQRSKSA